MPGQIVAWLSARRRLAPPCPCRRFVHELQSITAPFFPLAELGEFEVAGASELPEDYQALLAHDDHMTVTVEAFFNCHVDVRVLQERHEGHFYRRTSLLICQSIGEAVQFGAICVDLRGLSDVVRREIESRRTPLGRILLRHNVLRRVELRRLWRILPGPVLCEHLGLPPGGQMQAGGQMGVGGASASETPTPERGAWAAVESAAKGAAAKIAAAKTGETPSSANAYIYGRTARIVVEDRPAMTLLEIVKAETQ
ncbi:MAG: hypothetical protein IT424_04015 [Pirellulales bacterium]|nr:hypothetical protein [Pirellulales bacterium]